MWSICDGLSMEHGYDPDEMLERLVEEYIKLLEETLKHIFADEYYHKLNKQINPLLELKEN